MWIWIGLGLVVATLAAALFNRVSTAAIERAHPTTGRITPVTNGAIHWTNKGQGAPVVLIHGLAGNQNNFAALGADLARDYRVITIDRPGCGLSHRDEEATATLSHQADMIAEFLKAEGIERPLLVGHSMGGAVSLAIGQRHPEQLRAMALIAPLTQPERVPPPAFKILALGALPVRRFVAATYAALSTRAMVGVILRQLFAPEPVPKGFLDRFDHRLSLRGKAFLASSSDLALAEASMKEIVPGYPAMQVPGGVLFGDQDNVLHPKKHSAELLEACPHLIHEEMAGRGHMLPVTIPAECGAFVRRVDALV